MDPIVIKNIPCSFDLDELTKKLRVRPGSANARDLKAVVEEASQVAHPAALFRYLEVQQVDDQTIKLDGIALKSRILRVNLDKVEKIFPFVVTCGMELEEWANSMEDSVWRFWGETIKETALYKAHIAFMDILVEQYQPGHLSTMSPGSLEDWPISQQTALFHVLGDTVEMVGVRLTDSLLMIPTKSVSGVAFPMDSSFTSCQLCPRQNCMNRRSPYDETLYEQKYCPATA